MKIVLSNAGQYGDIILNPIIAISTYEFFLKEENGEMDDYEIMNDFNISSRDRIVLLSFQAENLDKYISTVLVQRVPKTQEVTVQMLNIINYDSILSSIYYRAENSGYSCYNVDKIDQWFVKVNGDGEVETAMSLVLRFRDDMVVDFESTEPVILRPSKHPPNLFEVITDT